MLVKQPLVTSQAYRSFAIPTAVVFEKKSPKIASRMAAVASVWPVGAP